MRTPGHEVYKVREHVGHEARKVGEHVRPEARQTQRQYGKR